MGQALELFSPFEVDPATGQPIEAAASAPLSPALPTAQE
jgi:hypothetical protein